MSNTMDAYTNPEPMRLGKVILELMTSDFDKAAVTNIIVEHHSYVPIRAYVGRRIDYVIKNDGTIVGTIGVGSAILAMGARDKFIGWTKEQKKKNLVMLGNNYRFTMMPQAPHNCGSIVLGLLEDQVVKDWMTRYGDKLVMLETLVKPPRTGTIYRAANWTLLGETKGALFKWILKTDLEMWKAKGWHKAQDGSSKGFLDKTKIVMLDGTAKKLIFVKPLNKGWKKYLTDTNTAPKPHLVGHSTPMLTATQGGLS